MPATSTVGVRYMIDDVPAAIAFYTTHLSFTVEQDASPATAQRPHQLGPAAHARWHPTGSWWLEPPAPAGR